MIGICSQNLHGNFENVALGYEFPYLKSMKFTNYKEATEFLFGRSAKGMKLGLENISTLADLLGNPEKNFPSIHVAGTNGKGSTVAILESILRAAGLKTGRFISPHLVDMRERMKVRGQSISEENVIRLMDKMLPHIKTANATFFECLTAMAFLHFSENKVDLAVLETGLGGRLDATNIVRPDLTIITEIGLEHTRILGKRLDAIAFEKAGILKASVPCVCGATHRNARASLTKYAKDKSAPITFTHDTIKTRRIRVTEKGTWFDCDTADTSYKDLKLGLLGRHQIRNAAVALTAVDVLRRQGKSITEEAIRKGLEKVDWHARLELFPGHPKILLDSAHNPMGVRTLIQALRTIFTYNRLILVFGVLKDKNYKRMIRPLAPLADEIVLTRPLSERALEPHLLLDEPGVKGKSAVVIPDIPEAWEQALKLAGPDDLVCGAGSIYFVGEVLRSMGITP